MARPNNLPTKAAQGTVGGANAADTAITRTLAAAPTLQHYVTGFRVNVGGATAGSIIQVTLTGLAGGTQTYPLAVPTGPTLVNELEVRFPNPIAATGFNAAVTLTVPNCGAGSTAANANLYSFSLSA